MDSELRQEYATHIEQQASIKGLSALHGQNLQNASNFTIANLYAYLN
jgi:hypothetical protein